MFTLTTPRRLGGLDVDDRAMLRVLTELGAACTTTSWIAQISATAKSMFTGWMTPQTQEAFYADPDAWLCGTAMPLGRARVVAGGLRISGRWPYASGCLDAPWAMVGIGPSDDDAVRPHPVLLPTAELTIDRTWDGVDGLRGTGSHTLVAHDVFVSSAFQMVPPSDPDAKPVATAGTRLLAVADVVDTAIVDGTSPSGTSAAQQRRQVVAAVRECRSAVEALLDVHGSSAFAAGNPLARFWRDLAVGSRHGVLNPYAAAEGYGRALVETADTAG